MGWCVGRWGSILFHLTLKIFCIFFKIIENKMRIQLSKITNCVAVHLSLGKDYNISYHISDRLNGHLYEEYIFIIQAYIQKSEN